MLLFSDCAINRGSLEVSTWHIGGSERKDCTKIINVLGSGPQS